MEVGAVCSSASAEVSMLPNRWSVDELWNGGICLWGKRW